MENARIVTFPPPPRSAGKVVVGQIFDPSAVPGMLSHDDMQSSGELKRKRRDIVVAGPPCTAMTGTSAPREPC